MHSALLSIPLLLGLLAAPVADDPAELRAKLDEKLAKPFVKSGGWRLDYDKARKEAAENDKLLFVYFTRTFAP